MATEAPANPTASTERKPAAEGLRRVKEVDVKELEQRVHLAELRAREAEAELRYIEATEKRKALKLEGRERSRGKRRDKGKRRRGAAAGAEEE
ncbi:MAG TPA: hypothetical protein VMF58_15605 [Rhizomicrobium sp.]|nr:hypothetical protein [Rhizomicrobium sp.]